MTRRVVITFFAVFVLSASLKADTASKEFSGDRSKLKRTFDNGAATGELRVDCPTHQSRGYNHTRMKSVIVPEESVVFRSAKVALVVSFAERKTTIRNRPILNREKCDMTYGAHMMRAFLSLIALCILNNPASAYLSAGNQRLDHAIWPAHAQKLIVAGEIKEIRVGPAPGFELERQVEIGFNVTGVILGDRQYGMRLLDIDLSHFDWPQDFVKFEKAARCILVLRRDEMDGKERCSVVAVVPAHRRSLKRVEDGEQAKRVLEEEILAELKVEKSPARQTALLVQMAPILSERHAEQVAPFATSKNQWVKRAALAALIYATEDKEYIRLAATDVQAYLSTTDENDLIDGTFAPYPYFFNHYFFLEKRSWTFGSRWDEKEAEKHLRILNTMLKLNIIDKNVANTLNPKRD